MNTRKRRLAGAALALAVKKKEINNKRKLLLLENRRKRFWRKKKVFFVGRGLEDLPFCRICRWKTLSPAILDEINKLGSYYCFHDPTATG